MNARGAHGPDARAKKAKPVRVRRCPATVRENYSAPHYGGHLEREERSVSQARSTVSVVHLKHLVDWVTESSLLLLGKDYR